MDASFDPLQVVGYYSQPYNDIVHPDRVWRVPKYFLRRWGPYLNPSRFWSVVAARQFAYWNQKANCFTVYDKRFAQEACLSTIHFRRIKTEMAFVNQPLSLFLGKEQLSEKERYHVVNGQTKPKPTTYYVRLDDPLTPADAQHLAAWFQEHNQQRRAEDIVTLLKQARMAPRKQLLAPALGPYLADLPAQFRYLSVLDIVGRVYGSEVTKNSQVKEEAEALHSHLTGPDYYGKEYFRANWLEILSPGPAFLVTYLRSLCFFDDATGERRDEVTFTRPELASNLGVTTKTLGNWLEKIAHAVPEQAVSSFMTLIEQKRISSNDVLYRYKIEMLEPLTPSDLGQYKQQFQQMTGEGGIAPQGKNDNHDLSPKGKNEHHEEDMLVEGQGKNDDHDLTRKEKMRTGEGKNEEGSTKKRWPYKYYQTLIQTVSKEDTSMSLMAADWSSDWMINQDRALLPFAQVVCENDYDKLWDILEVDGGGPTRSRIVVGGLSISEIVAWYLYAMCQKGLTRPPVHMVIARAQQGITPPEKFLRLAKLSWELWRCYASLLTLHPVVRDAFRNAPEFALWMEQYGRYHPSVLPLHVGEGVAEMMTSLQYDSAADELVPEATAELVPEVTAESQESQNGPDSTALIQDTEIQELWRPMLAELKGLMTLATFNTWLKDATLVRVEEDSTIGIQRWVVGVRNSYAVDWLTNRLNKSVIEPLAVSLYRHPISITYIEQ